MSARTFCSPAVLLAGALLLTACGGAAEADAPGSTGVAALDDAATSAPEECLQPFPISVGGATLDDVELVPADWPAEPAGAVLCGTGGTLDGNQDYAQFAVPLDAEAVLAYYEGALPAGYTVEPTDTVSGPGLTGTAGTITFVVEPKDGGVNLVFARG
jgi:hypothetical protein